MKMVCIHRTFFLQLSQFQAVSRLGWPILSSAPWGEGGGIPLCIGKKEVGTYIYSRPYSVQGALGGLL